MFDKADKPNILSLGRPKMLHSHAGYTVPSVFSLLTNAPQYADPSARFIPDSTHFIWVPDVLLREGYYSAFITPNQTVLRYSHAFRAGWSYTDFYWSNFRYSIDKDINKIISIWRKNSKPKFVLLLTMETHAPFPYSPDLPDEYFKDQQKIYDVTNQILAVEALDKEFKRLWDAISDGKTVVSIFSDHGTLDPNIEGYRGHAFHIFHRKLFEVPFVRGMI